MQRFTALCALLCLLSWACDPTYLDNGRLVRDGNELHAAWLPWLVVADSTLETEVAPTVLPDAIEWWNEQCAAPLFELESVGEERFWELYDGEPEDRIGYVLVSVEAITSDLGWNPDDDEPDANGDATLHYCRETRPACDPGGITWAEVRIDYEIAYHEPTSLVTLIHEFGHTLGLADDPESLDLGSCMSSPTFEGCGLTSGDRSLVCE
jgi:hypothetical protein